MVGKRLTPRISPRKRFCKRCDKLFNTYTKYSRICPKCNEKGLEERRRIWAEKRKKHDNK